jgi:hypothetical protein
MPSRSAASHTLPPRSSHPISSHPIPSAQIVLSKFISNPDAAELAHLAPRLATARLATLDASYCLQLQAPSLLEATLVALTPSLTTLELMACSLGDEVRHTT